METTLLDVKIHYEQIGDRGPCVLFLHGWGCSIRHFEPIMQAMADGYRLYAIDFPAHGQSGRPPVPWGVDGFARLTEAFIQERGIAPCDIVAHSFGGRVALKLSAAHPELVHRLVLTGCAGLKKEKTPEQQKKEAAYKRKKEWLNRMKSLPLLGAASQKLLHALQQKYGSADYNALDDEMKKTFVRVVSEDLRPCLEHIQAPTLLVWGEHDDATPLWMGKTMAQEIPDAGLVVFEGQDHFAYLREWPRFVTIVKAFLN